MNRLPSELVACYLATDYVVHGAAGGMTLRVGDTHPRLDAFMKESGFDCWAFITAFNPGSHLLEPHENEARQLNLLSRIRAMGHPYLLATGVPDGGGWMPEASVLVIGLEETEARALGCEFGQNAVVCGRAGEEARLVWCLADIPFSAVRK